MRLNGQDKKLSLHDAMRFLVHLKHVDRKLSLIADEHVIDWITNHPELYAISYAKADPHLFGLIEKAVGVTVQNWRIEKVY